MEIADNLFIDNLKILQEKNNNICFEFSLGITGFRD